MNEPIDYLAIGPIFGTNTKNTGYRPRGLDVVRAVAAAAAAHHVPVVGIGGISLARAPAVIAAGAQSVAVISDLLVSGDPRPRARVPARPRVSERRATDQSERESHYNGRLRERPVDAPVTSKPRRSAWTQKPLMAVALLAAVVVGGTAGYVIIEGCGPRGTRST